MKHQLMASTRIIPCDVTVINDIAINMRVDGLRFGDTFKVDGQEFLWSDIDHAPYVRSAPKNWRDI